MNNTRCLRHATPSTRMLTFIATLQRPAGVPRPAVSSDRHAAAAAVAAAPQRADSGTAQTAAKAGRGRRLYELVVAVMAGPPESVFRFSKVCSA